MRRRRVLGFLLLLGGCTSSPTMVNEVPVTVTLHVGNRVELVQQHVTLQFNGVTSDSRCPVGALCIVAGRAVLDFGLSGPGVPAGASLALATDRPDSSLGMALSIEELTPFRQINMPEIDPRAYQVRLTIAAIGCPIQVLCSSN